MTDRSATASLRVPLRPNAVDRVPKMPTAQGSGSVIGMSGLPQYEYVRLADRIEADIRSGRLPVGAALPGERAMTEVYQVSIGTVRRAVRELRERGLVVTLPNKGTFVKAPPEDAPE